MTAMQTVEAFLDALASFDLPRVLALAADDIVYQNVPLAPARGKPAFAKQMRMFAKLADKFEVHTHHIAENGAVVLTERTDAFIVRGTRVEFWVCGTFEVQDGLITLWRDSFDWAQVVSRMLRAAPRMAASALLRRRALEPAR